MRLLDKILSCGLMGVQTNERLVAALRESQLVVIDNVAEYYFSQPHEHSVVATDFPNVMLPFKAAFLEMRFPSTFNLHRMYESAGILLTMQGANDWKRAGHQYNEQSRAVLERPDIAYHLNGHFFLHARGDKTATPAGTFIIPIDKAGQIVASENRITIIGNMQFSGDMENAEKKKFANYVMEVLIFPTLLAISFMHCRNVKMVEEIPPTKLSKKHEKKGGRPLLRYRILQIDHMKEVLEREGGAGTTGLKRALHICRGHFKTYGKDGKGLLFGKHAATVFVPMHTRGNKEHGIVVKDYEVK